MGGDAYRDKVYRITSWANPTRVQRTEEDFVVRIPGTTNNVAKNTRKEGN
jgi:hypothetical protein